jgi:hypothetical protein
MIILINNYCCEGLPAAINIRRLTVYTEDSTVQFGHQSVQTTATAVPTTLSI